MSLTLHYHPLSSYCHKALIALYENGTPFERRIVNLMDPAEAAAFKKLWPCGQFPVLQDGDRTVPESSIIIEYLDQRHPGKTRFIPADPERARQVRFKDRFFDLQLHAHMQKIVIDKLRPEDKKDPTGVEQARARMTVALDMIDAEMAGKTWAMGDEFTLADCAAAPSLHYAERVHPFDSGHSHLALYLARLKARPSVARVLREAQPYEHFFPQ